MIDYTGTLPTAEHEVFVQEFVRLELDDTFGNPVDRKISCLLKAYPEKRGEDRKHLRDSADKILKKQHVKLRIKHLLDDFGSGIENEMVWTQRKSESALLRIISLPETKDGDRLKAIDMLNKLRKIGEEKEEDAGDAISQFFAKLGVGGH